MAFYVRNFTTTCPGALKDALNDNVVISSACLQIIVDTVAGTSTFEFNSSLSTAEETELDAVLAAWTCPLFVDDLGTVPVTQTTHGFQTGDVIYLDPADDLWKKAIASNAATLGVAIARVKDSDEFCPAVNGVINDGGIFDPGKYYYVSATTPGALTTTEPPPPNYSNPILYALTIDTASILPLRASRNEAGPSGVPIDIELPETQDSTTSIETATKVFNFGDHLTVTDNGGGTVTIDADLNGDDDFAIGQLTKTGSQTATVNWVDVQFDTIHIENDSTVIDVDPDKTHIDIKEDGYYLISYGLELDSSDSTAIETRVQQVTGTDYTLVASERSFTDDDEKGMSNVFVAYLQVGERIELEIRKIGADCHITNPHFTVIRLKGVKGDKGDAGVADEPLPIVQGRRTSQYSNIPLSFTDLTFDTTDVENNDTIIEHDDTNRDRFQIKEDGWYQLTYSLTSDDEVLTRVRINDSSVIPGSEKVAGDPNDVNDVVIVNASTFYANLSSGDYVTLQICATTSNEILKEDAHFAITKMQGAKGDQGAPGSPGQNLIKIREEGSTVSGSPFDTINFIGPRVTASDGGSAVVDVSIDDYIPCTTATLQTTNATQTTLQSITIPGGEERIIVARVKGNESATNDTYGRVIRALVKNVSGTASIVGGIASDQFTDAGASGWSIDLNVSGSDAIIQVTGEAAHTIDWETKTEVS